MLFVLVIVVVVVVAVVVVAVTVTVIVVTVVVAVVVDSCWCSWIRVVLLLVVAVHGRFVLLFVVCC